MRFWMLIWSFAVASFAYGFVSNFGDATTAILFGTATLMSVYLWVYTLVQIISTDFPIKLKINLGEKQKTDDCDHSETSN